MKAKSTKRALLASLLSLVICISMLVGSTFAWFTDSVTSANNIIKSGNLDVELYFQREGETNWTKVTPSTNVFKAGALWEPGYTEVVKLKVVNEGSLALKYQLGVNIVDEIGSTNVNGTAFKLSEFIKYGIVDGDQDYTRETAVAAVDATASKLNVAYKSADPIQLLPKTAQNTDNEDIVTMVVYMPTTVGNDANHAKDAAVPTIKLGINLFATQATVEKDSFDELYDKDSTLPSVGLGTVKGEDTAIKADGITVAVPEEAGDGEYKVVVDNKNTDTDANNKTTISFDITLTKDGVPVTEQTGVEYEVIVNVGENLDITKVLHKGAEVTGYTYDPAAGTLAFTTSSFSPFEVVYYEVPEGSVSKIKTADGKMKYFTSFAEAFAAAEDGDVITLMADATLTDTLVFDKDVKATLDLGGKTISGEITTLIKLADGELTIKNGTIKNVHAAATETKYSVYMSGDAKAEIKDVNIETSGVGIYMTDNAHITELSANVESYMTANGYCCYDAISMVGNARIDLISGGEYESRYSDEYIAAWNITHSYSGIISYTVNLNDANVSIGEISGGKFLGVMDKANNGTPIHVNNGTVELISGGYFGFSETGLTPPDTLLFVNTSNGGAINKITGGTFVKGDWKGFGCDFAEIVEASGCQVTETGETVDVNIQFSTKVTTYTLDVVKVTAK